MSLGIFGSSNPQPVAYTGEHLKGLEALYNDQSVMNLGLTSFFLTRLNVLGTTLRMLIDGARFASHAFYDCSLNKEITPLALDSLAKSGSHIALSVATAVTGIFSPAFVFKMALAAGIIPIRRALRIVTMLTTIIALASIAAAYYTIGDVIDNIKPWAVFVVTTIYDISDKAHDIASKAVAYGQAIHHFATLAFRAMSQLPFLLSLPHAG